MKPVRLLCYYMFLLAFLDPIVYNVQKNSYHFTLIDQQKHRIYLVTFSHNLMNKQTKDCAPSGSFQHKLKHRCFEL